MQSGTRDITRIEDIRDADLIPRLLRLLAARTGSEYVTKTVARSADCDRRTVERYLSLLENDRPRAPPPGLVGEPDHP